MKKILFVVLTAFAAAAHAETATQSLDLQNTTVKITGTSNFTAPNGQTLHLVNTAVSVSNPTVSAAVSGTMGDAPREIHSANDIVAQFHAPGGVMMATMAAAAYVCGKGAVADPDVLRANSTAYDYFLGLAVEEGRMAVPVAELQAKATKALASAKCDQKGVLQL